MFTKQNAKQNSQNKTNVYNTNVYKTNQVIFTKQTNVYKILYRQVMFTKENKCWHTSYVYKTKQNKCLQNKCLQHKCLQNKSLQNKKTKQ